MQESVRKNYLAKLSLVIPPKAKGIKFRGKKTKRCQHKFCNGELIDNPDSKPMLLQTARETYSGLGVLVRKKWYDKDKGTILTEKDVLAFLSATKVVGAIDLRIGQ